MIAGTVSEVPVNLTMRHVCRLTPQTTSWVGVCAAKRSGHDTVAKGAIETGAVG